MPGNPTVEALTQPATMASLNPTIARVLTKAVDATGRTERFLNRTWILIKLNTNAEKVIVICMLILVMTLLLTLDNLLLARSAKSTRSKKKNNPPIKISEPTINFGDLAPVTPGPNFGRYLRKRKSYETRARARTRTPSPSPQRGYAEFRTGRVTKPGYQTPGPYVDRAKDMPYRSNFSSLARTAPVHFAKLKRTGMIDEKGTPTKKWRDHLMEGREGVD